MHLQKLPRKSHPRASLDTKNAYIATGSVNYGSDVTLTPLIPDNTSTSRFTDGQDSTRQWNASIFHAPLLQIIAIILSLMCTGSGVFVLLRFNGSPVDSWFLVPPVYLSIITLGTNNMLRFAFSKGVFILYTGAFKTTLCRTWRQITEKWLQHPNIDDWTRRARGMGALTMDRWRSMRR